jgi:hypothetical protein
MSRYSRIIVPESKVSDILLGLPTMMMDFVNVPANQIVEKFEELCCYLREFVGQTFGFIERTNVRANAIGAVLSRIELAKIHVRDSQCPVHGTLASLGTLGKNDAARLALYDLIARINAVVLETDIMDETYPL